MTQRERHTSDNAPQTSGDASFWAEWYRRASADQQRDALDRAVRQGILHAHELPTPVHSAAPQRSLLSALLAGQIEPLQPLHPPDVSCHDDELDATQRDAVARAVATPDICLIQGFPGTGKSRLLTEIVRQVAQRGERILFLAATSAALDRVLERLGTDSAVFAIRCLAAEENAAALPAGIARWTLPERLRSYRDNTIPAARAAHEAARQALDARQRELSIWTTLEEWTRKAGVLAERLRLLTDRPNSGFIESETRERLDAQIAVLRAELETISAKQNHLEDEWKQIQPLAEARQGRRFWTGAWWSGLGRSGLTEQAHDLETRRVELQTAHERLEQDIAARLAERVELEARYAAERDAEIAALGHERDALRRQWGTACESLPCGAAPAEMSAAALASARAEWHQQRTRDEQQALAAEQWLQAVEEGLHDLPEKLARCANVTAATTTTFLAGARGEETSSVPFDLLIFDEAHDIAEAEFLAAARQARRWVLIGEPASEDEMPSPSSKPTRSLVPRNSVFQRLWRHLHADPQQLPFAWTQREDRLVCRLRAISAEQERWIETEAVADRPDIDLHILSVPRQPPRVVEVVFPACLSLAEAKLFIYRELDELAVRTRGRSARWEETADDIVLRFAANNEAGEAALVALEDGVRERIHRVPSHNGEFWHTNCLLFSRSAGWTRPRAEQWIAERLGLRILGRTVLLTVPHRLDPPLAHFLSDLLFDGVCEPAILAANNSSLGAAVEFVAVPSLAAEENRRRAEAEVHRNSGERNRQRGQTAVSLRSPRPRSLKGGAGLEMDLADNRPIDELLPSALRAELPRYGLVNYLEARALVNRLQALLAEDDFRTACERWQKRRAELCEHGCISPLAECDCPHLESGPVVAVMALYPAQVELLRCLIRQTNLVHSPIAIEVGLPSAFHQRECLLALVSLTRSHTHRAVSYGEHPRIWTQALTRAASRLILFGDPGTLLRRSQWHGVVDRLDESAARREGRLIEKLVQYLHGRGLHSSAFHLQEGHSV